MSRASPGALTEGERERVEQADRFVALGEQGVPGLLGMLSERSWTVRRAVVSGLVSLAEHAVGPLCAWLRDVRSTERGIAAAVDALVASNAPGTDAAVLVLEEEFGATTIETEGRVPMHSPVLAPVARTFRAELARAPFRAPSRPYVSNVSGGVEADPTPDVFVDRLTAHVTEPVRWRSAIEQLWANRPGACFVEVGPGGVLFNMLSRRWLDARRAKTDDRDAASLDAHLAQTVRSLRGEH